MTENQCLICSDSSRNQKIVCVLKKPSDVIIFERTGYNGLYHILGNLISPIDGINEEDLNVTTLIDRLNINDEIQEILIATDASIEGDSTALLISEKSALSGSGSLSSFTPSLSSSASVILGIPSPSVSRLGSVIST